ncbi:DUF3817 domain-containing protein [Gordonia sp. ABSL1-1]|uniref:DUF3817 domain-containing protein n=1 Tax=Gordonia sp. ABSL1-1 TaxID=3053923 RepID=UPI002573EA4F|nr:DUF3817 domain-containing protein [Gordonia sp. ABSL1-1]MDL9938786.1 DUF3817 domain-containing protein [Gordonia sp. ABSL1-1]
MTSFFDLSTPAKRFRFVAVLEAITWAILIVAMVIKRVFDNEDAIFVPGMAHGVVFVAFILVALLTAFALRWNAKVTLLALVSSIPPFGTIVFEWWAARNGHLAELSTEQSAAAPA